MQAPTKSGVTNKKSSSIPKETTDTAIYSFNRVTPSSAMVKRPPILTRLSVSVRKRGHDLKSFPEHSRTSVWLCVYLCVIFRNLFMLASFVLRLEFSPNFKNVSCFSINRIIINLTEKSTFFWRRFHRDVLNLANTWKKSDVLELANT